ncbi:MAG TPA: serine hydrolase domain-containing protein [Bryobacteraceae bacterium]
MNRTLFCVFVLSVAVLQAQSLPQVSPAQVGLSPERLTRIRPAMERDIAEGEMAGAIGLIARHGKIAYFETYGMADREADKPMTKDAIFRMYSMTKAVVAVSVMTLYEEGRFSLHDPISKFLPEFAHVKVAVEKTDPATGKRSYSTVPAERDITILDLMRHTSGLNYAGPRGEDGELIYKKVLGDMHYPLSEFVRRLASAPLVHQPGTVWDYSYSIDVLARLIEVVSGKSIDEYFSERVFQPLHMVDTGYYVPEAKWNRLVVLYTPHPGGTAQRSNSPAQESYQKKPALMMGGSGLVSTASDYARFVQMLLNGGELDGVRILSPKTVDLMRSNLLGDLPSVNNVNGRVGYGFGLTFAVNLGIDKTGAIGSKGEYNWGGAAGTAFWIDPKEDMIGVFMVQVMPQRTVKDQFKQLAYQAIVSEQK